MGYIYKYLFKNMSRSCWAYTMKLLGNENLFIFYVTSYLQISLQYRTINNDNIIRTSMLHNCSKKGHLRNRYHVYIRFKGKSYIFVFQHHIFGVRSSSQERQRGKFLSPLIIFSQLGVETFGQGPFGFECAESDEPLDHPINFLIK